MAGISVIHYISPVGVLEISCTFQGIVSIDFTEEAFQPEIGKASYKRIRTSECLVECTRQLEEYFKGTRRVFDLELKLEGTDFQKKVWKALLDIPYGCTATYGEIAAGIGNPKASRAVGNANNKNRIPIIIPCHRVVGSNGKLTGYAGGLWRKEWLLSHEKNTY